MTDAINLNFNFPTMRSKSNKSSALLGTALATAAMMLPSVQFASADVAGKCLFFLEIQNLVFALTDCFGVVIVIYCKSAGGSLQLNWLHSVVSEYRVFRPRGREFGGYCRKARR